MIRIARITSKDIKKSSNLCEEDLNKWSLRINSTIIFMSKDFNACKYMMDSIS